MAYILSTASQSRYQLSGVGQLLLPPPEDQFAGVVVVDIVNVVYCYMAWPVYSATIYRYRVGVVIPASISQALIADIVAQYPLVARAQKMSIGHEPATSAGKGSSSSTPLPLPISIQKYFILGVIYIVLSLAPIATLYRLYLVLPSLYTTPLLSRKLDIAKRRYLLVVQLQRKLQVRDKGITSTSIASSLLYLAQPSIYSILISKKADRYITSTTPWKSTPTSSANVATIALPLAFYLAIIYSYLLSAISTEQKGSSSFPDIYQPSALSTIYTISFSSPARPDTNLATTLVLGLASIYLYCIFLLVYLLYTIGVSASSSSLFLSLSSILGRSVPVIYICLGEIRFIMLVQQAIQGQKSELIRILYALSSTTQSMLYLAWYLLRKACYVEQAIASGVTSTTKGTTSSSLPSSSRKIIPFILQDLR